MKYLIFFMCLIGTIPGGYILSISDRLRKMALFLIPVSMSAWNESAINFFSHEKYRGSARGMEISLTFLIIFTILISRIIRKKSFRWMMPGWWSYVIYFIISATTLLWATNPLIGWFEVWKMILIGMTFIVVASEIMDDGDVYPILLGFITLIYIAAFVAIYDRYICGVHQVESIFSHQNSFAMFMTFIAPLLFLGWLNGKDQWFSWFSGGGFLCASLCVFFSLSRGALACLPLGCAFTAPAIIFTKWSLRKYIITTFLLILAVVALFLAAPRIQRRFEKASKASGDTRVKLANIALMMTQEHPFGVGINNWGLNVSNDNYADIRTTGDQRYTAVVETSYLLVMAECGYVGLGAYLLFLGTFLIINIRCLWAYWKTPYDFIPWGLLGGLLAVYLQSILEWVLKQSINLTQLVIFCAIISSLLALRHKIVRPVEN